eukprot:TRINITY_DN643_c1_g3_i1.p1 TRINITY_DN643_c1_g3~~TRINITY_DN643_c1_g3_i1.p1  ORF type:complete len:514 (+),score=136.90 TRINITY_DN643_c1_g3_i1:17-1558(+)
MATESATGAAAAAAVAPVVVVAADEAAVVQAATRALEELLTPAPEDPFLLCRLTPELALPLSVVARQQRVAAVTQDIALLERAVRASKQLSLREVTKEEKGPGGQVLGTHTVQMVQLPVCKPKRDTIIMREVPSGVTDEDIKKLFEGANVVSIKSDINNTWFVTLPDEDQTLDAISKVRAKTIAGAKVKACIKAQNVKPLSVPTVKSPSPSQQSPSPSQSPTQLQAAVQQPLAEEKRIGVYGPSFHPELSPYAQQWTPTGYNQPLLPFSPPYNGEYYFEPSFRRPDMRRGRGPHVEQGAQPQPQLQQGGVHATAGAPAAATEATMTTTSGNISVRRHLRRQPGVAADADAAAAPAPVKQPQAVPAAHGSNLWNSQFPPLQAGAESCQTGLSDLPSGYATGASVRRYTRDEALRAVNAVMATGAAVANPICEVADEPCRAVLAKPMTRTEADAPQELTCATPVAAVPEPKQSEVVPVAFPSLSDAAAALGAMSPQRSNTPSHSYADAARAITPV